MVLNTLISNDVALFVRLFLQRQQSAAAQFSNCDGVSIQLIPLNEMKWNEIEKQMDNNIEDWRWTQHSTLNTPDSLHYFNNQAANDSNVNSIHYYYN